MHVHYIYKTTSSSGKYYIGRHSTENMDDGYLGSGKWIRQMNDTSNLTVEVLEYAKSFEHLLELEEDYLAEHVGQPGNMNFNNRPIGFATGALNWNTTPEGREFGKNRRLGKTYEDLYGEDRAIEIREKISKAKIGVTRDASWNSGLDKTDPRIARMSENISSSIQAWMATLSPDERKEKFGNYGDANGFYGRKHSDKTKELISAKARSRPKKVCEHCGKAVSPANHTRWHGKNCRKKS